MNLCWLSSKPTRMQMFWSYFEIFFCLYGCHFFESQSYYNSHLQGEYDSIEDKYLTNSNLKIEFENNDMHVQHALEQDLPESDTVKVNEKQFKGFVYTIRGSAKELTVSHYKTMNQLQGWIVKLTMAPQWFMMVRLNVFLIFPLV